MNSQAEILIIIPARGGSKGIPRKNIKLLNGKPLIAYTIEGALESKFRARVIVSTEDEEIKEVSIKYGAEVPFLRPEELSRDTTPGMEPILHAIDYLQESEGYKPDYVMCLQCTSPLRTSLHIDEAVQALLTGGADSIVSVCESEVSPYWMKSIEDNKLVNYIKELPVLTRRQDLPKIFRLNGAIYAAKREVVQNNKSWYTENTLPYVMDRISSVDIDDMLDFMFAELLLKENCHEGR